MRFMVGVALALVAITTVHCKTVWETEEDTNDEASVDLEPYLDDFKDELIPRSFQDLILAGGDEVSYDLTGCSGNQCSVCFKVWKFKGCLKVAILSNGFTVSVELLGRTVFTGKINVTNGSYTIRISKSKVPGFLRKLLKSDIYIKLTGINLAQKKMCFQFQTKVRWIGTLRWPRRSPKCITL